MLFSVINDSYVSFYMLASISHHSLPATK